MIITNDINMFRESIRHLWNSYLKPDADWDTLNTFRQISSILFKKKILANISSDITPIPLDVGNNYIPNYKIFMNGDGKLPVMVNRDIPPSGYWDYPIEWLPPEMKPVIKPICFFDWDVLGWRMLEYYHVRIIKCVTNPDLDGRDALINCSHVEIAIEE